MVRSQLWHRRCAFLAYPLLVFTARELEVAALIRSGRSLSEIAGDVGLALVTVKARIGRMRRKTGAANRLGIVRYIRRAEEMAALAGPSSAVAVSPEIID